MVHWKYGLVIDFYIKLIGIYVPLSHISVRNFYAVLEKSCTDFYYFNQNLSLYHKINTCLITWHYLQQVMKSTIFCIGYVMVITLILWFITLILMYRYCWFSITSSWGQWYKLFWKASIVCLCLLHWRVFYTDGYRISFATLGGEGY